MGLWPWLEISRNKSEQRKRCDKAMMNFGQSTTAWWTAFLSRTLRQCGLYGRMRQSAGCSATRKTELRSLSVSDIHPAEALPYILENIPLVEEPNQTPPGNIPFLRKDGSVFYAEVIGKFLTYDGRPCSMGIFRDITERRQAEAALAESEAKYRQLVETTDTGYLILDAEGLVVDANEEVTSASAVITIWLKSQGIAWWNGRHLTTGPEMPRKSGNAFKRGKSDNWRLIISALMARLPPLRSMRASSPPRKASVSSLFVGTSRT